MQQDVVRIAQARSQRIAAADDAASEAALAHIEVRLGLPAPSRLRLETVSRQKWYQAGYLLLD
jgi:hypothetical protein